MARVNWTPKKTEFFVKALVDECRAGNRPETTLNRIGKANVVRRMSNYTKRDWNWETCSNKWDELKRKWSCWKRLNKCTGLGFKPNGAIDMPPRWWKKQLKINRIAKVFQRKPLEHEEDLDFIFAKMEPVNVGPDEDGGHEGGRAGVPTEYLDSDTSHDSVDDLEIQQHTPPLPKRATSITSAATGKRHATDPGFATADFFEGLKKFYEDISTSKKQKHTDVMNKVEEDAEYETLMRELIDAGVKPKSDEYFMASEVLLDVRRRGAYCPLSSLEDKLDWIKKTYHIMNGRPPCL